MNTESMHVGFTGTKKGLTPVQCEKIAVGFAALKPMTLHHGDCKEADEAADKIAHELGIAVIIHPPIDEKHRAFCKDAIVIHKPLDYLERDHVIVDETVGLIACPKEEEEVLRSGTWATIRYARKQGRTVCLILPSGKVILEAPVAK